MQVRRVSMKKGGWVRSLRQLALILVALIWLAAPAPYDKEYDGVVGRAPPDPDVLEVPKSAIDTLASELRERARAR